MPNNNKPWVFIAYGTSEKPKKQEVIVQRYVDEIADVREILETEKEALLNAKTNNQIKQIKENILSFENKISSLENKISNSVSTMSYSSYMFLPTNNTAKVIRIEGAGTADNDSVKNKMKNIHDGITADSEDARLKECIKQLREAKANGELPDRIVLNGFSRGAVACIKLAREIYLEFGEPPKIAMHLSDPVPGPGRHVKSKMVIPPNVDSLMINYFALEKNLIFKTQDLREIFYDSKKTTVTTKVYPTDHNLTTENKAECLREIRKDNENLWKALKGNEIKIEEKVESISNNNLRGSGSRKGHVFSANSDNKGHLQSFQNITNSVIQRVKEKDNKEMRERELKNIYGAGKRGLESKVIYSPDERKNNKHKLQRSNKSILDSAETIKFRKS